jgi:hypothetical protein
MFQSRETKMIDWLQTGLAQLPLSDVAPASALGKCDETPNTDSPTTPSRRDSLTIRRY